MPTLNLDAQYLAEITPILKKMVPNFEVWAYGSRVKGSCHEASDLDLVIRNPRHLNTPIPHLSQLKQAFQDSNLPIFIDIMDWASLPKDYQTEITRKYVVIQPAKH